ncbi:MAG: hypothetical protein HOB79_01820 [Rhodospirillaceae bacterium]|nr:hypothetical protein [Rhodospirillaceae bacterium]
MKRRDFFRLGAQKAAKVVSRAALDKIVGPVGTWIRPPYSLSEVSFQQACTRCDACIEACTYDVLFKLTNNHGPQVADTPAMDLVNKGCHMCENCPCVAACEAQALVMPGKGEERLRIAQVEIDPNICLPYAGPECGACAHSCPVPGALEWQDRIKPVINQSLCSGCALCREACIVEPKAVKVAPAVLEESAAKVS